MMLQNVLVAISMMSSLAILWGLVNLIYPFGKLRIRTRRDALVFVGASSLVMLAAAFIGAIVSANDPSDGSTPAGLMDQANSQSVVATPGVALGGEIGWQIVSALAFPAAIWFFINVLKPIARLGIKSRGRATLLLFLSIAAIYGAYSGRHDVVKAYLESIKDGDKEVYLAEVKDRLGEKAWWDALKETDPDRWSKLKNEQQAARAANPPKEDAEELAAKAEKATEDLKIKQDIWIVRGQEAVENKLKDPGSAEFRNMFFSDGSGVPMSCGEVNSKNSFGGYTGFQKYVSAGSVDSTFLEEEVADFHDLWNKMCVQKAAKSQSASTVTPLGDFYVTAESLNERATPNGKVVNKIYRGQKLTVYRVDDGWALTTAPGSNERWVSYEHLSRDKPAAPTVDSPLANRDDPRIERDAIPMPGEYGLKQKDVDILWRGAFKMLETGKCSRVVYGDKSTSKANTYFVTCEGSRNVFFTESDL